MKKTTIIGISRGCQFSPNHIDNDAAIFTLVAEKLKEMGYALELYTEQEFAERSVDGRFIFNMARDKATIQKLKQMEDDGATVINSAYGIENCVRKPMTELLIKNGIPHPASIITGTDRPFPGNQFPCWIKRGDSHAIVKEDVSYATTLEEANAILSQFNERGIPEAVVNEHLQGDLVKFYGVCGSDFFYWFYPDPCSHSKFGLEIINGQAKGTPFSAYDLKRFSEMASKALNVPVYGGDCIVLPDGGIKIIDFNDWPSFARCRHEAGVKIAEYIHHTIIKKQ